MILLICCILISAGVSAAEGNRPVRVLYYMIGSDLESKKEAASADLMEMLRTPPGGKADVWVLAGGAAKWKLDRDMDGQNTLLHLAEGTFEKEPFPEDSMGDGETLKTFLRSCAPEEGPWHLIFWGHGSPEGIGRDENHGGDTLSMAEIRTAIKDLLNPPRVIGMDACGMYTDETLSELAGCCSYFVGSRGEEPPEGWPHQMYLAEITGDGQTDAERIREAANIRQKRKNEPETTFLAEMSEGRN